MSMRSLRAVQFRAEDGEQMLAALAAALDGSGPAIMPLDPDLPGPALERLRAAFAGASIRADTAAVIATSGSTGRPKAVELSAAALIASATASLRRIGARPGERWLCCLPTFHVSGLGVLVRSLVAGSEPVFAAVSREVIAASGCAFASLVPTQLRRLLDSGAGPGPLQTVLLGGAASAPALLAEAQAAGWHVVTTYGMSETSGGCVYDHVPLDDVQVRLTDGMIEISGPTLFSGYLGEAALTSAVLAGGWFRTADLGAWRPDGTLAIRGRADDVINSGGEKVVPGEVEAVLGTDPGIADVVVVGVPDRDWGEAVTAVVIPAGSGNPPDLARLRSNVRGVLSAHAAPSRMVVVPQFPLLPSGKPDRAALRERVLREVAERGATSLYRL